VGSVGTFACIGLNYSDHAAESGMAVPAEPVVQQIDVRVVAATHRDLKQMVEAGLVPQ
jgi:2-keto-4-pentenoate hydratase/2-oxohepta-3-ene-1,7-dioic acid hydratase in catechol pathway